MTKLPMSAAAGALLRALIARAAVERHRILLSDSSSTDWQSLTFTGERHQLTLRITGRDSAQVAERVCAGLEDAEFSIAGMVVADIGLAEPPRVAPDGTTELTIESLTILAD